jgi:hypothetical protein
MRQILYAAFALSITLLPEITLGCPRILGIGLAGRHYNSTLENRSDTIADSRLDYVSTYKAAFGLSAFITVNRNFTITSGLFFDKGGVQFRFLLGH